MSDLYTFATVKRLRNLLINRFLLLVFVFGTIFSVPMRLMSQTETPQSVSNEALFKRAFKSISFILMMAGQDKVFLDWLTPEEKKMYEGISSGANEITTLNWLEEKGVEKISNDKFDSYFYVITKNRPVTVQTPKGTRVKLQFSENQELFKLNKDEPIRTAVTEENMTSDIFVNLKKINNPNVKVSLGEASALIVHELGHKLGKEKIQTAVDSLAVKVKQYLDSQISVTDIPNGRVLTLIFKNAPFDHWMEGITFGYYQGVNVPFKFIPLIAYDMEGSYVLLETNSGVQDLTDDLFKSEAIKKLVSYKSDPHYKWGQFNWFLSSGLQITAKPNNRFNIEINLNQLQFVLPFWQSNSYNPATYDLYGKAFEMQPNIGLFSNYNWEIDYRKSKAVIATKYPGALKYEKPQFQLELVKQTWENEDLIISYKIKGSMSIQYSDDRNFKLWPELVFEYQGKRFEVRASSFVSDTNEYTFRIAGVKNANSGVLKVVGLDLVSEKLNLAQAAADLRVKTFLQKIEEITLSGSAEKTTPTLKSIQIWDGSTWLSLEKSKNKFKIKGQQLRFVFHANEKLRSLSLLQNFEHTNQYSSVIFPGTPNESKSVGPKLVTQRSAWLLIEEKNLRQSLQGSVLIVDIEVDKEVNLALKSELPVEIEGAPSYLKNLIPFGGMAKETASSWVEGMRSLQVVKFVSQSLQVSTIPLRNILHFEKSISVAPAIQKSCGRWFKK